MHIEELQIIGTLARLARVKKRSESSEKVHVSKYHQSSIGMKRLLPHRDCSLRVCVHRRAVHRISWDSCSIVKHERPDSRPGRQKKSALLGIIGLGPIGDQFFAQMVCKDGSGKSVNGRVASPYHGDCTFLSHCSHSLLKMGHTTLSLNRIYFIYPFSAPLEVASRVKEQYVVRLARIPTP